MFTIVCLMYPRYVQYFTIPGLDLNSGLEAERPIAAWRAKGKKVGAGSGGTDTGILKLGYWDTRTWILRHYRVARYSCHPLISHVPEWRKTTES